MWSARLRLACLWVSQDARVIADWALRLFVVLTLAADAAARPSAWHLATAVFMAPFVLLAPFNGALSNTLPKRWVLIGSTAFSLAVVAVFAGLSRSETDAVVWLLCLGLLAIGSAVYSPTRYALLPAASRDAKLSLPAVNALIEMGSAAGIVIGVVLALRSDPMTSALAASVVSLAAALPVWFRFDVRRPEGPAQAVADFFRETLLILRDRRVRGFLLGLGCFMALVTAGSGAVFLHALELATDEAGREQLIWDLILVIIGVPIGAMLAGLQGHIRRGLGLVPIGTAGLLAALVWGALTGDQRWPAFVMGFMAGLVTVPLRAAYQDALEPDQRGNGMAVSNTVNYLLIAVLALLLVGLVRLGLVTSLTGQLWLLTALAAVGVLVAGRLLMREVIEELLEIVLWSIYRIRAHGPGMAAFPRRGPVIVLGNHSAWLDPIWVGKVMPRRLYPMMTSVFFDQPILHFLMTRVVHAIRVPLSFFRREAPELREAVEVLKRSECLLIFPEGMLRRKEDQFIRQFGQGIWHILRDCPDTPIVVCWIQGGWGSYTSYKGGPPTKNKRPDWWRHIDIGVSEPFKLDPRVLDDQRATRTFLMRACVEARRHLGLEVPALPEQAEPELEEDDKLTG